MTYVGVGEYHVSKCEGEIIKTLALGSCIAVVALSTKIPLFGLWHVQLPDSSINPEIARQKPSMFADTAIALMIKEFSREGCPTRDITTKLVGGAQVLDPKNTFSIGKRNYLAIKKILWANRMWPMSEDVGGDFSRSVSLVVGNEEITISSPGRPDRKI